MKKLSSDTLIFQSYYNLILCLLLLYCQAICAFWAVEPITSILFPKALLAAGKILRAVLKELLKRGRIKIQNDFQ